MRWGRGLCVVLLAIGPVLVASPPSYAAEWTAKANLVSGRCGSGAVAKVVEQDGAWNVAISLDGKASGEGIVKLAVDGSGKTQMQGASGPIYLEIPAGTGKRSFRTRQVSGSCEWVWN
jgi:hypothetical protein